MTDITLVTAVDKTINDLTENIHIPAGSVGHVLDVIIEDGKVSFLLDFEDLGFYEWFDVNEVEEKC